MNEDNELETEEVLETERVVKKPYKKKKKQLISDNDNEE
jgi:predicted GIY-YIG superfamily endonuclease